MQRLLVVVLLSLLSVSLTANDADRARFKISNFLAGEMNNSAKAKKGVDVLIYVKGEKDFKGLDVLKTKNDRGTFVLNALRTTALESQKGVVSYLDSIGAKYQRFTVANIIAAKGLTPADIVMIANRADVKRVVADPVVRGLKTVFDEEPTSDVGSKIEAGVKYMKADKVWETYGKQGEGIVIAGQDTGVDFEHPALAKQYRGYNEGKVTHDYNWYDAVREGFDGADPGNSCGYASDKPCDDNEHGTHTIGSIVGDDGEGNQIGVAPKAQWIACRNMDGGLGKPSSYLACFQFFLAPFPVNGNPLTDGDATKAPHVINNSWGCPESEGCEGDEFVEALENLKAAGIMVVASAGNEGSGCSTIQDPPAHHSDSTLSVGAVSASDGNIAFFSSRGPSAFDNSVGPDVTAPGVGVRSSVPGGGYASFSGTSMAGPHVVGHIALLWSAVDKLKGKIDETIDLTRKTATPRTSTQSCGGVAGTATPNNTYGYGDVNTLKAVEEGLKL